MPYHYQPPPQPHPTNSGRCPLPACPALALFISGRAETEKLKGGHGLLHAVPGKAGTYTPLPASCCPPPPGCRFQQNRGQSGVSPAPTPLVPWGYLDQSCRRLTAGDSSIHPDNLEIQCPAKARRGTWAGMGAESRIRALQTPHYEDVPEGLRAHTPFPEPRAQSAGSPTEQILLCTQKLVCLLIN